MASLSVSPAAPSVHHSGGPLAAVSSAIHGATTFARSPTGKYVALAVLAGAGASAIASYNAQRKEEAARRRAEAEASGAPPPPRRRSPAKSLKKLLSLLLKLGGRRILTLVGLAIARTALSNRLARIQGHLFRAAFLRRVPLFFRNLAENVALCLASSAVESTLATVVKGLELRWREWVTDRIHKYYFDNMAYYKLAYVDKRVDSPEQRVCEDVPKLCHGLAELTGEWINAAVDGTFYAWKLQSYTKTNKYTGAIMAYILGAGTLTAALSPPFGSLYKKQQNMEGTYRHLHTRLRANAEAVALYGGIGKEAATIQSRFKDLIKHTAKVLGLQWKFGMVQDFLLKYLGATVAVVLIIGPFFAGHLRPDDSMAGRAQMLSNMRYHTAVVIALFGALGTLASSSRKFMKLGAHADRVDEMMEVVRALAGGSGGAGAAYQGAEGKLVEAEDEIVFEGATVVTPGNAALVRDLSLRVPLGTNLLVTGPNGAGKSSLFRVLGGLWPLTKGTIAKPGGAGSGLAEEIFYVPQRPYVTIGTLEEQILYPKVRPHTHKGHVIPPRELRELLESVELGYLLDREGASSAVVNWGETLSLGEQQRLGMARLFYHRPKFAILDECTSGVTNDMERVFCERVQAMGCTCVTISHRPALMAFHDLVLHLDGEGGWSVHHGQRSDSPTHAAAAEVSAEVPAGELDEPGAEGSGAGGEIAQAKPAGKGKKKEKKAVNGGAGAASPAGTAAEEDSEAKLRTRESLQVLEGMTAAAAAPRPQGLGKGLKPRGANGDVRQSLQSGVDLTEKVLARSAPPDPEGEEALAATAVRSSLHSDYARGAAGRAADLVKILMGGPQGGELPRLAMIGLVVAARTAISDRIASLNGQTVNYVLRQDRAGFIKLIGVSVLQSAASAVAAPSLKYMTDALALRWRRRLTSALNSTYLKGTSFYSAVQLAEFTDSDQRLTRDVERLCDDLAALIPSMVKPVVDIAWFSWRMWLLTGRRGVGFLYLYMVVGFGALRAVTPNFGFLASEEHHREGAFRIAHSHLRQHAESVAFYGGGRKEGETVSFHMHRLLAHLRKVSGLRWAYQVADDFFTKQLPHNVTWTLTLLYALENSGQAHTTEGQGSMVHNMRYLASVVTQCFSAFGEILGLQRRVAELAGGVTRVSEMLEVLKEAQRRESEAPHSDALSDSHPVPRGKVGRLSSSLSSTHGGVSLGRISEDDSRPGLPAAPPSIHFHNVDVVTPKGKLLARGLELTVAEGGNLLVTGPNGSGKSSIFRVLRGLWPVLSGSLHKRGSIFYVPQKPYTTVGTFREQLVYPQTVDEAVGAQEGAIEAERRRALDGKLTQILEDVRLSYLLERYRWDSELEWGETLSLGEQQRLGMARLFYHRPKFAILDECTNATSVDVEEKLYDKATSLGITLVTVTQRTALVRFHGRELRLLDGQGAWELLEIEERGTGGTGGHS